MRIKTSSSAPTTVNSQPGLINNNSGHSAVQNWLDQSLEQRGIDARVYGKYILSLLQIDQQDNDLRNDDDTDFMTSGSEGLSPGLQSQFGLVMECLSNVCLAPHDAESLVRELIHQIRKQQEQQQESPQRNNRKDYEVSNSVMSSTCEQEKRMTKESSIEPVTPASEITYRVTSDDNNILNTSQNNDSVLTDVVADDHPAGPASVTDTGSRGWDLLRHISVSDSEATLKLIGKFNQEIASIWTPDPQSSEENPSLISATSSSSSSCSGHMFAPVLQTDSPSSCWSQHQSGCSIWSFDPTSFPDTSSNQTSLSNHLPDSLFVKPNLKSDPDHSCINSTGCHYSQSLLSQSDYSTNAYGLNENLLLSAATHFQPIRQDFYERTLSDIVTETGLCALIPCSGKCPNHVRNRQPVCKTTSTTTTTTRTRRTLDQEKSRPDSVSLSELSLFVGPFAGQDENVITSSPEDHQSDQLLPTTESEDENHLLAQSHSGHNNTSLESLESSDDNCDLGSDAAPAVADDYDAICSIMNEVLGQKERLLAEEEKEAASRLQDPQTRSQHVSNVFVPGTSSKSGHSYNSLPGESQPITGSHVLSERQGRLFDSMPISTGPTTCVDEFSESSRTTFLRGTNNRTATRPVVVGVRNFVVEPKIDRRVEYQKPCSFFLEGNCRKSDCKFSHDLSRIVCKFWLEGFCFKAGLCPFRHSLEEDQGSDLNLEMDASSFTIESENDFPSLAGKRKQQQQQQSQQVQTSAEDHSHHHLQHQKQKLSQNRSQGTKSQSKCATGDNNTNNNHNRDRSSSSQVLFRAAKGHKKKKSGVKGV